MTSMWGEAHDKKMADFDNQIEAIENKYSNIFQDKINRLTGEEPDKLTNHFIVQWDSSQYKIGFQKDSYLPLYVKEEVKTAFISAFSDK